MIAVMLPEQPESESGGQCGAHPVTTEQPAASHSDAHAPTTSSEDELLANSAANSSAARRGLRMPSSSRLMRDTPWRPADCCAVWFEPCGLAWLRAASADVATAVGLRRFALATPRTRELRTPSTCGRTTAARAVSRPLANCKARISVTKTRSKMETQLAAADSKVLLGEGKFASD